MKSIKLNDWIQLVGIVAVVASLVFVGLELRQSQEIAIAAQYQARLDSASNHYTSIMESETGLKVVGKDILADIVSRPSSPPDFVAWAKDQPPEELAFRTLGGVLFLKSHDNVYFQYQKGFLSEEAWTAMRAQLKAGLHDPRTWSRAVFEVKPEVWRDSYRALLEEIIAEGPSSP